MAVCMLLASAASEALGRKPVMLVSVLASALLTIAAAFAPGWESFLLLRALLGIALSGLPAVAMAYITEELHPAPAAMPWASTSAARRWAAWPGASSPGCCWRRGLARLGGRHRAAGAGLGPGVLAQPAALAALPPAAAGLGRAGGQFRRASA
ncbi:MFS transporter [Teichococcus aestuarii]|uniref:MFS transporter n=1 Tax=Teichococcus aestuarii TaxID=568898 RepID=UPI00360FD33F